MEWQKSKNHSIWESHLKRKYGITAEDYYALLEQQGGGCAICGKTPEQEGKRLAVEHNHKTREIRAICCSYCNNWLIGRHNNPELLRKLADYLEGPHTGWFVPKPKKKKRKKWQKIVAVVADEVLTRK